MENKLISELNLKFKTKDIFEYHIYGGANLHPGPNLIIYFSKWGKWEKLREKYSEEELMDYFMKYLCTKHNFYDGLYVGFVEPYENAPLKYVVASCYRISYNGNFMFLYNTRNSKLNII